MPTIAKLDKTGLLTGFAKVKKPKKNDIVVPDDCDLKPGRYRWDGKAFMPVRPTLTKGEAEPDATRAIAAGLIALREQGIELPQETVDWLDWFRNTIDGRGL